MIIRLMRYLASHKAVFNIDVDVNDKTSLEQALDYLNGELLGDVKSTREFCLQGTARNKLLKLRFVHRGDLLSKRMLNNQLDIAWAEKVRSGLSSLNVRLSGKEQAVSEFIFAHAALSHPELVDKLVDFVDRITIFSSMPEGKLLSYSDLVSVGLMSAVAILLYAPEEKDSAIALFNALGKFRDGSYSDRFAGALLVRLYKERGYDDVACDVFANHLASFMCYPDSRWSTKIEDIETAKLVGNVQLVMALKEALVRWGADFIMSQPDEYLNTFIRPVLQDEDALEQLTVVLEPLIAQSKQAEAED